MTIEILVAHYNGSRYIDAQLESIRKNTLPSGTSLSIRIIDDASRPEELQNLLNLVYGWPNVTVVPNKNNLGVIGTFAKGLQHSNADYVMLCDQDDIWLPNKVQSTFECMRGLGPGPAMVFTNLTTVDNDLNILTERMVDLTTYRCEKHKLLFQNIATGCTIMVNRELLAFALPFPPDVAMHDHWIAICAAFAGRIGYVSEPTILYRQHDANLVGEPHRGLIPQLSKPFKTVKRFRKGLWLKARQARALSERLAPSSDQALVRTVADAFERPSFRQLKFLIRTRVFDVNFIALLLLCLLYLLPGARRSPQ